MAEKRSDAQIFILGHRPVEYGYWDDALYTPLQVGADFNPPFTDLRDNQGDNIGALNPIYAESTGTYFIWKNIPHTYKYIGQIQYRRRLQFARDEDFDKIFTEYDAICARPLVMGMSVYEQLAHCHNRRLAEALEKAVKELYPEMSDSFDHFIKGSGIFFYSNSFVLRQQDFNRYAEFMFNVIEKVFGILGLHSVEDVQRYVEEEIKAGRTPNNDGKFGYKSPVRYQMQYGGFLGERLWTLWVRHNFSPERIKIMEYLKYENV